jgi:hypothetical protein
MEYDSHAQTMEALEHANEVRLERAKVKLEMRHDPMLIHKILIDIPDCMKSISVLQLLEAQKRYGPNRSVRVLGHWPNPTGGRRLDSLTLRERRLLSEQLKKANRVTTHP